MKQGLRQYVEEAIQDAETMDQVQAILDETKVLERSFTAEFMIDEMTLESESVEFDESIQFGY